VLVPLLIPAKQVRDTVTAEIQSVTGLSPLLRGKTSVSLFPSPTVTFADMVLGDNADGEPPFAAERLTAQLRLLPLFVGRIEIADLLLVEPRIHIEFDGDGRSNWSRLIDSLSRSLKPGAARTGEVLSFSQVRISEGTIRLRDRLRRIDETFTDVALSLAWPSLTHSFGTTGRLAWRGEPVDVTLSVSDLYAALTGDNAGVKLRFAAAPMNFAFDGSVSYRPALRIQGALAADSPSFRNALRWAGQKPLPGGGFGPFALKAKANILGNTVSLPSVNIELDGNAAEGVLGLVMSPRPVLQGTLAAEELDLSRYVSVARLLRHSERDWSRTPIVLDALGALDLDVRLSAGRVTVMGARLGRTAIASNLRNGVLAVTIGESQAFGGILRGAVGLGKGAAGAELKAQLQFNDVDLESCLGEFFAIRRLEGKGNLALNVEGSGTSLFDITRTLNGEASLAARQGALSGLNIEQALRRFERQPLSGGSELRSGQTPFDKLSIVVKFAQGIATVEQVQFESPRVRLAVAGSASIPARDLNLKGIASLIAGGAADRAGAFQLPFVVQGRWDDPVMLPDAESLIRHSRAAGPLLDAVKGRSARDLVRSAIDQLTRGAAPAAPAKPGIVAPTASNPAPQAPAPR
jgi:AsmA protein